MRSNSTSVLCALAGSALIALSLPSPASAAPAAVAWTGFVNASASGSALSKTGGCASCYDAGAFSQQQLTSGSVTFSVPAGQALFAGLGHDTSTSTSYAIDYAFRFYGNGTWEIREGDVYKTEGPYAPSDQYTIAIAGGVVTYSRNWSVVYTSKAAASGTYVFDTSIETIGAAIQSAQITTSSTSTSGSTSGNALTWTALVNAAASGSTVTKTSGCDTCSDAGGLSQQQLTSGSVTFGVPAGQRLRAGVGHDVSSSTSNDIDYAFQFYGTSTWEIRESGVYKTEGPFASGDTYTVSVSTTVTYYRNSSLVYTSQVAPTLPLVLHASLESIGAAVQNASMSGAVSTPSTPPPTPPSPSSPSGSKTLRVLQWNTHHGGYGTDGVYSPDRIATWAASFAPDVVMFNEIERNDSWGNQDQPEVYKSLLQQKTGKTWYYVFAQEFGQWSSSGKGNLILSSYPINVTDRYELVHNGDRSIALATITVNSRDITLISTHLDPYDASLRLVQATEVTNWAAGQPENRIITGDMNAWPDQTSIAQYDTFYNDSWGVASNNGTATAFSGNSGETKNGRIDYIFYSKNASSLSVVSSQVYDTRDANGVTPSDHRPVLTVFSVR
jgi:endonuclease/exonuclease/phosphatase family metal-dependent hydrolase